MDRVSSRAKRHVLGRIELAGVGEMLEQLGEKHESLPLAQPCGSMSVDSIF